MEGWQEYQLDNEALDENCLLLNMDVEKLENTGKSVTCHPDTLSYETKLENNVTVIVGRKYL